MQLYKQITPNENGILGDKFLLFRYKLLNTSLLYFTSYSSRKVSRKIAKTFKIQCRLVIKFLDKDTDDRWRQYRTQYIFVHITNIDSKKLHFDILSTRSHISSYGGSSFNRVRIITLYHHKDKEATWQLFPSPYIRKHTSLSYRTVKEKVSFSHKQTTASPLADPGKQSRRSSFPNSGK